VRKTRGKATVLAIQVARQQRRSPTPAEAKLWEELRGRRLAGLKFRRQHPYDRFVLDAFCVEHQLEVEVDGGIHADAAQRARDAVRAEFLQQHGIKVLRFTNEQVEQRLEEVLRRIVEVTSSPAPSPEPKEPVSGEGEKVRWATPAPGAKEPVSGEGEKVRRATSGPEAKEPVSGEGEKVPWATPAPGAKEPVSGEGEKVRWATPAPRAKEPVSGEGEN
jgi:very-short-patch-repair endonuclease